MRGSNELGFRGPYLVSSYCVTTAVVREETESPLLKTSAPRWKYITLTTTRRCVLGDETSKVDSARHLIDARGREETPL
jgi:hypothetical protein